LTEFTPFDIWEQFGITEHLGGVRATHRLLEQIEVSPGKFMLDVGCGSGYTACLAARLYQVRLIGVDINGRSIVEAKERVKREGLEDKVFLVQADGHKLPFEQKIFDQVLVESVLVFCEPAVLIAEIFRVLNSGGGFSGNEITLLSSPSEQLCELLQDTMGIHAFMEQGWHQVFQKGGFTDISSKVYQIRISDQFVSHIKIDGLKKYLKAVLRGVMDAELRRVFFTREMYNAARKFMGFVGYGIYRGRKNTPQ
jgi:ubiquinone/menaquinone biosynthesis C-methylase UbiE